MGTVFIKYTNLSKIASIKKSSNNLNCDPQVSGNQIFLEKKKIIPIGRAYKNGFLKRLIG